MKHKILIQVDLNNKVVPQGIDLSDSFISHWKLKNSEFKIELELSVWPESPYYIKPIKEEFTCYKKGNLRFYGIKEIKGVVDLEYVKPNLDPDGSKDWDNIYDFRKENGLLKFSTEFTNIEIDCDGFEMEINKRSTPLYKIH